MNALQIRFLLGEHSHYAGWKEDPVVPQLSQVKERARRFLKLSAANYAPEMKMEDLYRNETSGNTSDGSHEDEEKHSELRKINRFVVTPGALERNEDLEMSDVVSEDDDGSETEEIEPVATSKFSSSQLLFETPGQDSESIIRTGEAVEFDSHFVEYLQDTLNSSPQQYPVPVLATKFKSSSNSRNTRGNEDQFNNPSLLRLRDSFVNRCQRVHDRKLYKDYSFSKIFDTTFVINLSTNTESF